MASSSSSSEDTELSTEANLLLGIIITCYSSGFLSHLFVAFFKLNHGRRSMLGPGKRHGGVPTRCHVGVLFNGSMACGKGNI